MNIAIVVQGRFHAFDLARELTGRGNQVTLLTNYPEWAVRKYGAGSATVRSYWPHGVGARIAERLGFRVDAAWNRAFGRWAASELRLGNWDVVHTWSGVSLELIREHGNTRGTTQLMRGSAHIRTQAQILRDEQLRAGVPVEQPSPEMIAREEEEYALAERVLALSTFAYRSFVDQGVSPQKLCLFPLGVNCTAFRPPPEVVLERRRRILSGAPLRVISVGSLSLRKGTVDAVALVRAANPEQFEFRFVGEVSKDAASHVEILRQRSQVIPRQPQNQLSKQYAWADLFFTPTIEDGFAVVLCQAQASGLPILSTTNCAGPDLVREGETGWIVPIRSPEALLERLLWCDSHREELAAAVDKVYTGYATRDWRDVARDFEAISQRTISQNATLQRGGRL